jgi:hypothetical protein
MVAASSAASPAPRAEQGPQAPATRTAAPASRRASVTAAALISASFSARPNSASLTRLAPKVFVSITSAPAAT